MTAGKRYSLGKTERLKSRKQIDLLFASGKKIAQFPFRILYHSDTGTGTVKAGFTVSSKTFPRAVDRNRIKRLMREAYRLQKKELEELVRKTGTRLDLFIIYTGKDIATYNDVFSRLKQVLDKLIRLLYESNTPTS